jgi:hypothetical protein
MPSTNLLLFYSFLCTWASRVDPNNSAYYPSTSSTRSMPEPSFNHLNSYCLSHADRTARVISLNSAARGNFCQYWEPECLSPMIEGPESGNSMRLNFTFMWPCIVKHFFVIKPTRCTNFTNLFWHETTCFRQFVCPSSGVYSLYTQQWYMSYSFRAGLGVPSWSCKLVSHTPLLSIQWINSWWWTENCPKHVDFHA